MIFAPAASQKESLGIAIEVKDRQSGSGRENVRVVMDELRIRPNLIGVRLPNGQVDRALGAPGKS